MGVSMEIIHAVKHYIYKLYSEDQPTHVYIGRTNDPQRRYK